MTTLWPDKQLIDIAQAESILQQDDTQNCYYMKFFKNIKKDLQPRELHLFSIHKSNINQHLQDLQDNHTFYI